MLNELKEKIAIRQARKALLDSVIPRVGELGYAGWGGVTDDDGNETVPFIDALDNAFKIHGLNIPQHTLDYLIKSNCLKEIPC